MHTDTIKYKYHIEYADSPLWAFAIHDGHEIDETLHPYLDIDEAGRLREEDPHTARIAQLPINRFIVSTSRFQIDINRDKENTIYLRPEQAWGLNVWKSNLPSHLIEQMHRHHDHIYGIVDMLIEHTIKRYGYFAIYDIHSYNAKRSGPDEIIDEENNPQMILGTATNHRKWADLGHIFMETIRQQSPPGQQIDIRENVKFSGGNLSKFINSKHKDHGCILFIEFRKDFMDEWTGEVFPDKLESYRQLLLNTLKTVDKCLSDQKECTQIDRIISFK